MTLVKLEDMCSNCPGVVLMLITYHPCWHPASQFSTNSSSSISSASSPSSPSPTPLIYLDAPFTNLIIRILLRNSLPEPDPPKSHRIPRPLPENPFNNFFVETYPMNGVFKLPTGGPSMNPLLTLYSPPQNTLCCSPGKQLPTAFCCTFLPSPSPS